jgi:hypothetical protein
MLHYEVVQGGRWKVSLDWPKRLEMRVFQANRGSVSDSQKCQQLQESIMRNEQEKIRIQDESVK